jgi:hypothetical protein
MTAIPQPKSAVQNRLEGYVLTALFQGFPTYAVAVLAIKLMGAHEIVGERGGAAIFVVLASIIHALLTAWLGPKFPKFFRQGGYEPLFFEPGLSFPEKIAQWRVKPEASVQLVSNLLLMSLLAVGVVSFR